jgi:hypothetical protein
MIVTCKRIWIFPGILSFALIVATAYAGTEHLPVQKGVLDLSQWNSAEQPIITLDGEWNFYWGQLLSAGELSGKRFKYAQLSVPWNEQEIDGRHYPRNGFATYVLKLTLPRDVKRLSFWMPAVFNSWSLWIDDVNVASAGVVSGDAAGTTPMWKPNVVDIEVSQPTIYVSLQIANFQGTRGGCAEIPKISRAPLLHDTYSQYVFTGNTLIILFLIVALVGLVVYATSGASAYLAIAFVAVAFIVRFLFSDLYLVNQFTDIIPWIVTAKLEYGSMPMVILASCYFIRITYPIEFPRVVAGIFIGISGITLIAILFLPSGLLSETLVVLQLTGLAFALVIFITIIRALYRQRRGAWLTALSFFCFASIGSYNIYAFVAGLDLDRTVIHAGYAVSLILSVVSLHARTPMRLQEEALDMLRYEDLYKDQTGVRN